MSDSRTTELREKLDSLGISHFDYDKGGRTQTLWEAPDGKRHFTYETSNNPAKTARLVVAWYPTIEQAIAATLGDTRAERTCEFEERCGDWYCTECGGMVGTCDITSELYISGNAIELWNYCPTCGAKVVDE